MAKPYFDWSEIDHEHFKKNLEPGMRLSFEYAWEGVQTREEAQKRYDSVKEISLMLNVLSPKGDYWLGQPVFYEENLTKIGCDKCVC